MANDVAYLDSPWLAGATNPFDDYRAARANRLASLSQRKARVMMALTGHQIADDVLFELRRRAAHWKQGLGGTWTPNETWLFVAVEAVQLGVRIQSTLVGQQFDHQSGFLPKAPAWYLVTQNALRQNSLRRSGSIRYAKRNPPLSWFGGPE